MQFSETGGLPKRFKGAHSKCARPVKRCEGSNPLSSAERLKPVVMRLRLQALFITLLLKGVPMKIKQKPAAVFTAVLLAVSLFQPVSAGTWHTAGDGLYYREAGKNTVGWKRIADESGVRHWYYFGEDGRLARNIDTPDGFRVNEAGIFGGISDRGVSPEFAAAEKAAETARQAAERAYYEDLYRKKAEEEARAAASAAGGPGTAGGEAGDGSTGGGNGMT